MATGTVSTLEPNQWQTISTSTPTSGTAVTFSSISGYKTLMLAWSAVTTTAASATGYIRFNSATVNYASAYLTGADTVTVGAKNQVPIDSTNGLNNYYTGYITVNNVINSAPKIFKGVSWDQYVGIVGTIDGVWNDTSALTSITFTITGTTFSSSNTGVFTLYGIAA